MTESQEAMLKEFAEKLGTTTQHLWEVLIRQAFISSMTDLVVISLWVAGLIWACQLLYKHRKDWDEGFVMFGAASAVFGILITAVIVGGSASTIMAGFLNPEYWALDQVLSRVK